MKKPGPAERRASVKARGQKHRSALSFASFWSSKRKKIEHFYQAKERIKRNYRTLRQAQGDKKEKELTLYLLHLHQRIKQIHLTASRFHTTETLANLRFYLKHPIRFPLKHSAYWQGF